MHERSALARLSGSMSCELTCRDQPNRTAAETGPLSLRTELAKESGRGLAQETRSIGTCHRPAGLRPAAERVAQGSVLGRGGCPHGSRGCRI
jgi:hypothetical protein